MKIYKVSGSMDSKGLSGTVRELEVDETAKSYKSVGSRISKDKIMKVDTIFIENHRVIRYFTYCLEGQQQEAFDMLKAHIILKVETYKKEIDNLYSLLNPKKP